MKLFSKGIILLTLFVVAFSWTAFFEKLERLRDKEEKIKKNLDLKSLGLSHLKDLSLKDLAHFHAPDLSSKLDKLKHIIPKDLDPSHHKDVAEFWNGVFSYLKLDKPTELIDCFGTVSGPTFFRKMRIVDDLLQHSKEGNMVKLHTDYASFEVIMHALEHTHKCVFNTKDFERLTKSLSIPNDFEVLKNAKYLYYEAKYTQLADDYKKVIEELDKKNFEQAGKVFGELFKASVKDYNKQGEDLLMYQAFGNGLSAALGVDLPSESLKCYNSKNAKILMNFFRGVSGSVAEGRWYKADESFTNYWEKEGEALLNKISKKVLECDLKSKESKQISEKIGMDIGSQEFRDKMSEYVKDHNIMFYSYLRSMKLAFEKHDYLHAGSIYAHLIEAVAKST